MAKYIFPTIFTQEQDSGYSITFPDLERCYSQGDNLEDAYEMAADVLCLTLYDMEESKEPIPKAFHPKDIHVDKDSFIVLVATDTLEYRMFYDNKAVKKNPYHFSMVKCYG